VVDKFLVELQAQLEDKRVVLEVDGCCARRGWPSVAMTCMMGARPMARLIQEETEEATGRENPVWRTG
jgi:ATP-dependent Clp protease ATP-binding subunit ClpA